MNRKGVLVACSLLTSIGVMLGACGGSNSGSGGSSGSSGGSSGSGEKFGSSSGSGSSSGGPGVSVSCPTGTQCNVSCSGGGTTTISGTVYDPAGKNPLYNANVYVPGAPLTALPKGVLTGADACSCGALFPSGAVVSATTGVDGTFTLTNVPVGSKVPLVVQIGKWRRSLTVNVDACKDNPQTGTTLSLPGTVPAGDVDDNMPDIAVSTGSADSLECLMLRMGIPASEYVAGAGGTGHIHVFSGGEGSGKKGGGGNVGTPEKTPMPGAPASYQSLWDSQADLMPYDILLLSCEGGETYNANPPALESYLNAGGRAFASHFHYAWFSGPIGSGQGYSSPADWGNQGDKLANFTVDQGMEDNGVIGGQIVQTLNGGSGQFAKGAALDQWLGKVNALGQNGQPATELSIYQPRFNATVTASQTASQPWITADNQAPVPNATMYFSFDTPINPTTVNGSPQYCGRAVFSDLHVSGDPSEHDTSPPPNGCDATDLSPQEKALEFMLFDLSSCVIPDTVAPPTDGGLPSPPR